MLIWDWVPDAYDLVVAVFIQFLDPEQRSVVFAGMVRTLRPGGRLLLHGYRPEQVNYGTGGPSDPAHMYTEALLTESFADLRIEHLDSYDIEVHERRRAPRHIGAHRLRRNEVLIVNPTTLQSLRSDRSHPGLVGAMTTQRSEQYPRWTTRTAGGQTSISRTHSRRRCAGVGT